MITSLVADPGPTSATLYAGTKNEGLFKSTDGGVHWTAVNTGLGIDIANLSITALVMDPDSPNTLYAGTVSGHLFKTATGGVSWFTMTPSWVGSPIYALAIRKHPGSPTTVYASKAGVVYKSTDGGVTWTFASNGVSTVQTLLAPSTTWPVVYAGTSSDGVYANMTDGTDWIPFNSGLATAPIQSLAVDGGLLYAATDVGSEAFVTRLDQNLQASSPLFYSTFLGGSSHDGARSVAISPVSGDVYVAGVTTSSSFPTTPGSYKTRNEGTDAFVLRIKNAAAGSAYVVPRSKFFRKEGGTAQFRVIAPSGTTWNATPPAAAWLRITSPSPASGVGLAPPVTVFADPNTLSSSRTATLSIASTSIPIVQAGASCTYGPPSPSLLLFGPTETTHQTINVLFMGPSPASCQWQMDNASPFVHLSAESGTGPGHVDVWVDANLGANPRTAELTFNGMPTTVLQYGNCRYTVSPPGSVPLGGGFVTISVTTVGTLPTYCHWTASVELASSSWLTIHDITGLDVHLIASAISPTDPSYTTGRTGYVVVAGSRVAVTQLHDHLLLRLVAGFGGPSLFSLGLPTLSGVVDVRGAVTAAGGIYALARDKSGKLWLSYFDPIAGKWGKWLSPGTPGLELPFPLKLGAPAITTAGNSAYFSVCDPSRRYCWVNGYTAPGSGFSGWARMAVPFTSDPAMAATPSGVVYLAGKGADSVVAGTRYSRTEGATVWGSGGRTARGGISATISSDGALYVAFADSISTWLGRVIRSDWTDAYPSGGSYGGNPRIAAVGDKIYVVTLDTEGRAWYQIYRVARAPVGPPAGPPWVQRSLR